MATKEELQRRLQRIFRWFLPVMIIMLISTVLSLVGVDSEPVLDSVHSLRHRRRRILRPSHQILDMAAGRVLARKRKGS